MFLGEQEKIFMLLPQKFNQGFTIQWLYEGKESRDFTDAELQSIVSFDHRFVERQRLTNELRGKIINPLIALYNKHLTLKEILISLKEPCDRLLYNLIEDAAKQNITDFYDLMGKFIDVLKQYKNNYSPLFNKDSQKKLFMALKQGNTTEHNIHKYGKLSDLIDNKRTYLFSCFDQNGSVQNDSWDRLINDMRATRNIIKAYRDKVTSHADEELVTLGWKEAMQAIQSFVNYTSDIYTVLSFGTCFEMRSNDLDRDSRQTIKALRSILFN
jgi:hypothetical protein